MRIHLDITSALGDATGVGTYTRELGRALLASGTGHEIRLSAHVYRHPGWRARAKSLFGPVPVRASRLLPHGAALELDRLFGWPSAERLFGRCDVYHGTNFLAPRCRRARSVVTVHDLAFLRLGDQVPVEHRYERYLRKSVARASRVIAVSEATRRDVIDLLGIEPRRVRVVHLGAPEYLPALAREDWETARRELRIPDRFLLFVGTLEPRKNLVRLLDAVGLAAARVEDPPGVVLAGRLGWETGPILAAIARARRAVPVVRAGFVSEPLRNSLYSRALAVVLPSLYEGFGLPILEAFASGVPVVAGDAGSIPEIAGDAALLADPSDVADLAARIVEVVENEGVRRDLVERGRRRAGLFSWDRAARETLEVYEDA